jgi:exosortase
MLDQWTHDEDMGHAFLVPVVIAWIVWRERKSWRALPVQPSLWGLAIMGLAAAIQVAAVIGAGLFAGSVALLLSAAGAAVALGGLRYLRAWAFPFLLALFMLPKLAIVYNQVTLPLQLLASRIATLMLSVSGLTVVREGNLLTVGGHTILIAEACSGIRYLLSLGFIAVLFAYLADPKPWMRIALLASVVPIAILANGLRVAAIGLLPALEQGTLHALSGWLVFVFCLAALILVRHLLSMFHAYGHR